MGNKTINNITFNDSLTYFSCGFGIVVLDIKNEEFPEPTYFIGPEGSQLNVLDITFGADSVYAATESGIYKASLNSTNLANFNEWTKDQRLYPDKSFNAITFFIMAGCLPIVILKVTLLTHYLCTTITHTPGVYYPAAVFYKSLG